MKGKGLFREHSSQRSSFGKKVKGDTSNVVFIDLDDDNVVTGDAIKSSQQKFKCSSLRSKNGKFLFQDIINLDDDEDNDVGPGISVDADGDLVSDASSTQSPYPAFKTVNNSTQSDADECQVIPEKTSAFQFSKCKQTYRTRSSASKTVQNNAQSDTDECQVMPEKNSAFQSSNCQQTYHTQGSGRNRYGLDSDFDNVSVDGDFSDCVLIEDSFGKVREQWERASLKRKHVPIRHSGLEDQGSASSSNSEVPTNVEETFGREHVDVPVCSSSNDKNYRKESWSEYVTSNAGYVESTFKRKSESSPMDEDQRVDQESVFHRKPMSRQETKSSHRNADFQPGGGTVAEDPLCSFECESNNVFGNDGPSPQGSFQPGGGTVAEDSQSDEDTCFPPRFCDEEPSPQNTFQPAEGTAVEDLQSDDNVYIPGFWNEEPSPQNTFQSVEDTVVENPQSDENDYISSFQNEEPSPHKSSFGRSEQDVGDTQSDCPGTLSEEKGKSDSRHSLYKGASNHKQMKQVKSSMEAKEPNGRSQLYSDVTPSVNRDIINEREKLKETDEYKRAIEEEWASRQRAIKNQAEEANKLRKRRKAESMLKFDIERRQKQRIEEVRETQKKDQENIDLKEQLRCEIRTEINKLEMTCIDMASLLRGLGILVRGGMHPMPEDVHSAYKKALLKFHPDRASRTDIRQQVEAEEKFKLISRMKEKFLSTSCY
ncbi:uncharacterized protein LOC133822874 [Humulus lupulus]|uniref:uncharacterized protein LOC133822874 n=1 Tax=Humulus lupulus TaxID=3486 RepID=UPI002B40E43A|nr:uncharacterized protein LOC133822874 [Humulus lupulus]